jgi:hypothetical protein
VPPLARIEAPCPTLRSKTPFNIFAPTSPREIGLATVPRGVVRRRLYSAGAMAFALAPYGVAGSRRRSAWA